MIDKWTKKGLGRARELLAEVVRKKRAERAAIIPVPAWERPEWMKLSGMDRVDLLVDDRKKLLKAEYPDPEVLQKYAEYICSTVADIETVRRIKQYKAARTESSAR